MKSVARRKLNYLCTVNWINNCQISHRYIDTIARFLFNSKFMEWINSFWKKVLIDNVRNLNEPSFNETITRKLFQCANSLSSMFERFVHCFNTHKSYLNQISSICYSEIVTCRFLLVLSRWLLINLTSLKNMFPPWLRCYGTSSKNVDLNKLPQLIHSQWKSNFVYIIFPQGINPTNAYASHSIYLLGPKHKLECLHICAHIFTYFFWLCHKPHYFLCVQCSLKHPQRLLFTHTSLFLMGIQYIACFENAAVCKVQINFTQLF